MIANIKRLIHTSLLCGNDSGIIIHQLTIERCSAINEIVMQAASMTPWLFEWHSSFQNLFKSYSCSASHTLHHQQHSSGNRIDYSMAPCQDLRRDPVDCSTKHQRRVVHQRAHNYDCLAILFRAIMTYDGKVIFGETFPSWSLGID